MFVNACPRSLCVRSNQPFDWVLLVLIGCSSISVCLQSWVMKSALRLRLGPATSCVCDIWYKLIRALLLALHVHGEFLLSAHIYDVLHRVTMISGGPAVVCSHKRVRFIYCLGVLCTARAFTQKFWYWISYYRPEIRHLWLYKVALRALWAGCLVWMFSGSGCRLATTLNVLAFSRE